MVLLKRKGKSILVAAGRIGGQNKPFTQRSGEIFKRCDIPAVFKAVPADDTVFRFRLAAAAANPFGTRNCFEKIHKQNRITTLKYRRLQPFSCFLKRKTQSSQGPADE